MYLKRLVEWAEREELLESTVKGYELRKVDWLIKITPEGKFQAFVRLDKDSKHAVPYRVRSGSNLPPFLLYDKVDFVLGWSSEDKHDERTRQRHQRFCELVAQCAEKTREPSVQAVHHFLQSYQGAELVQTHMKESDIKDGQWMTFQIENEKPVDLPSVQKFWEDWISDENEAHDFQCVICGQFCSPLSRHKTELVLPVGGRDRAKLVSANDSAYFSYGLKNALNSPTCSTCEEKYGRALVTLLSPEARKEHCIRLGHLVYLFWAKQRRLPVVYQVVQPDPNEVQKLRYEVLADRKRSPTFQTTDFYALALSPNKARIVVRDWKETSLEQVKENVYRFFQNQQLEQKEQYYGVHSLVESLFPPSKRKEPSKEMTENLPRLLLNHAFFAQRLPLSIQYQAVQRCRAERKVPRARAAIIRLCLMQEQGYKEGYFMHLEPHEQDPGYLCGRLFAILEKIQLDAQKRNASGEGKSINATVTDKFYATASTTPAAVFGMLFRNAQHHLSKMRNDPDKKGWAVMQSKRLGEVMGQLKHFPTTLKLSQQTRFALGYFHQQNDLYKPKEEK